MKAILMASVLGLGLIGSVGTASAQYYGGSDYGYRSRDDGYGDRDRGDRYRDRDRGDSYGERGGYRDRERADRGYRAGGGGFDEAEYLRCNPDVRRAVNSGKMESASAHYRVFGRRENRPLTCR